MRAEVRVVPFVRAACAAALLLSSARDASLHAQERFTLEHVRALSGCWAGPSGDIELREQWTEAGGGVMLGTTRFLRGGAVVDWEFSRLVESTEGVTLWPYPRGVISEHGFPLARVGAELVFENLAHDYPVRIVYALDGPDGLRPRIEGADGNGVGWSLRRVPCPSGS